MTLRDRFVLQLTSELSFSLSSSSDRSTLTSPEEAAALGLEMLRVAAPGFEDRRSVASSNSGNV